MNTLREYDTVEEYWAADDINVAISSATSRSLNSFCEAFGSFLGVDSSSVRLAPSGRSALHNILKMTPAEKPLVATPAFTCPAVVETILKAGKTPRFFDFTERPGCINWEGLATRLNSQYAALIITHYFGVPVDFLPIVNRAKRLGVTLVEDCAHCLGAKIRDRYCGTIGDASFFSFSTDKPISLGYGGAFVLNTTSLRSSTVFHTYNSPTFNRQRRFLRELQASLQIRRQTMLRGRTAWNRVADRVRRLCFPELCAQETLAIGCVQAELGTLCLKTYAAISRQREAYAKQIDDSLGAHTWPCSGATSPLRIRQKVDARTPQQAEHLTRVLRAAGFRCGLLNWDGRYARCDLNDFPVSRGAYEHWLDVPIHQNLARGDFNRLLGILTQHLL